MQTQFAVTIIRAATNVKFSIRYFDALMNEWQMNTKLIGNT